MRASPRGGGLRAALTGALLTTALAASILSAQPHPTFDVVGIKPNTTSGERYMPIRTPASGVVSATNVTPWLLVRYAFDMLPESRIVGFPSWATTEHFDIAAKAPPNTTASGYRALFLSLLIDRFGFASHRETRAMRADVLTVASPGRLGPNVKLSPMECREPDSCGVETLSAGFSGRDASFEQLAAALTLRTRRIVVDRTGLTGKYDFEITLPPDAVALNPALATALREQLGLRIETGDEPIDVVVIDRLERPTID